MRPGIPLLLTALLLSFLPSIAQQGPLRFYPADDARIQYTGRIDFSNPRLPRFWQPGVYITVKIEGAECRFIVNDEELWGKNHNYLELVVDGKATRIQTKQKTDTIFVPGLSSGTHVISLVKNTEANIGYLELVGVWCKKMLEPDPKPKRKIEFIGNSITCGASADLSGIPCGKGVWHDQHNAYLAYGPRTARALDAQYHLSSVSGIGLMHSCCGMDIIMPQVYDKVSMRDNRIPWNFDSYQPDLVAVCLGQNDGIQDSAAFCENYVSFVKRLRGYYPSATIICLSSPMADAKLAAFMKATISSVLNTLNDKNVAAYFFSKQYKNGCDYHPDVAEHAGIAEELTAFIKKKINW